MPRLFCRHHRELETSVAIAPATNLRCQLCGSVPRLVSQTKTKKQGSLDPTIESADPAEVISDDANRTDFTSRFDGQTVVEPRAEDVPPPLSLSGYEIIRELGRGGMGVVYLAHDQMHDRDVALKTLQRMSPEGLHSFKQEFRALADIAHPNLASLYELLSDGETWCFTMELLKGVDFLEFFWSEFAGLQPSHDSATRAEAAQSPRLTSDRIQRLEEALRQLAFGLGALHDAGLLHSDIKPSNVFVTGQRRVVLLDFGLVSHLQGTGAAKQQVIRGTPVYMSPEQAAGKSLTPASDLYSVGVMLYEALTGQLPFSGGTTQVVNRKQTETPLEPAELASDTPKHLNDLCVALLSRDPESRPALAHVLHCVGGEALVTTAGAASAADTASHFQLVGRDRHLSKLHESFQQVTAGGACRHVCPRQIWDGQECFDPQLSGRDQTG